MNSLEILKNISKKHNGIILTSTAIINGLTRSNLSKLCKKGIITRIANGQYVLTEELDDELLSMQLRSKKIIFSHETALFLLGISDRTPFEHSITISTSKSVSTIMRNECKVYHIKDELYDMGKVELITPMGNKVWAYDMERTICDIVRNRKRISDETFISAIKNYAANPKKNLINLSMYASKMNILSKIRKYLEVLL